MPSRVILVALGALGGFIAAALLHGMSSLVQSRTAGEVQFVRATSAGSPAPTYVNAYHIHTTAEEVVFDLGVGMPDPNTAVSTGGEIVFAPSSRVVMTYPNAKRLGESIAMLVKRYELQFGAIPTTPPTTNGAARGQD